MRVALLALLLGLGGLAGCAEPVQTTPREPWREDLPRPCETLAAFWKEPGLYDALGPAAEVAPGPLMPLRAEEARRLGIVGLHEVQRVTRGEGGVGLMASDEGVVLTLDLPPGADEAARAAAVLRALDGLANLTPEEARAWARDMRRFGESSHGDARYESWRGARDVEVDLAPLWRASQGLPADIQAQPGLGFLMLAFSPEPDGRGPTAERVTFLARTGLRMLEMPPAFRMRVDADDGVALLVDASVPRVYYGADDVDAAWRADLRATVERAFAAKGFPAPTFASWEPQGNPGACMT